MQVFKPAVAPAALFLALALSGRLPLWAEAFFSSFIFLVCMSQQFHAWSHMKKSELHPAVVALQEAGLLIGRKAHGAHHRAPFEGNYCIVSGWWNELLDNSLFFRWVACSTAVVLWCDEAAGAESHAPGCGLVMSLLCFQSPHGHTRGVLLVCNAY